jgi:hypothetical protein
VSLLGNAEKKPGMALVVMANVQMAPYFYLFLFIAILNTDCSMHNLKRIKFANLWCILIFFDMLRGIDGCFKIHFFPFNYNEKQKIAHQI